jgi:hypothetical protein
MRKTRTECLPVDFRAYLDAELELMLTEVESICPVSSPGFNDAAIAWIARNAARFRKKWERYHNGHKQVVVGN